MKLYYKTANEIQAQQNGLADDVTQAPATKPAPQPSEADSTQLPSLSLPQK